MTDDQHDDQHDDPHDASWIEYPIVCGYCRRTETECRCYDNSPALIVYSVIILIATTAIAFLMV